MRNISRVNDVLTQLKVLTAICFVSIAYINVALANDPIFRPASFTDAIRGGSYVNMVDIDSDNDLDMFVSGINGGGSISFFRNISQQEKDPVLIPDAGEEPFGLMNFRGTFVNSPQFVDIDHDGDLDAFVGYSDPSNLGFQIVFYRNIASSTGDPEFILETQQNPFGIDVQGYNFDLSFIDVDNDGDQDLFIGHSLSAINFYRNIAPIGGTAEFVKEGGDTPFGLSNVGRGIAPYFVDIDGDQDVDAFLGTSSDKISFFRNMAGPQNEPEFILESDESPFGLPGVQSGNIFNRLDPVFVDVDNDTDIDAIIALGGRSGIGFFRNIAGPSTDPEFVQESSYSAFGLDTNHTRDPYFIDLEGDGDLDVISSGFEQIVIYRNELGSAPLENPIFELELRSDRLFGLPLQNRVSAPVLLDLDGDGDLDAIQSFGSGPGGLDLGYYRYENLVGVTPRPQFENSTPSPIDGLQGIASSQAPVLIDIDFDGDLDVFYHSGSVFSPEPLRFFRNISGTANGLVFVEEEGDAPFGLDTDGDASLPAFGDLDSDGDLDALVGSSGNKIHFFRNIATHDSEPQFVKQEGDMPFGIYSVNSKLAPVLVDIDMDGDLDIFMGTFTRGTEFMRNVLNQRPSFSLGSDQIALDNSGRTRVRNFVMQINDGDGGVDQGLSFELSIDNAALFSRQPQISSEGLLQYTPIDGVTGSATVEVVLHDDGGIQNGGVDTSVMQSFIITIVDDQVQVNSMSNSGAGTLRNLITNAVSGQTISFDESLSGQVMTLESPLEINHDLTINGFNAGDTVISGNERSGIFNISAPVTVKFNHLTLQNASDRAGAAINIASDNARVIVNQCQFTNNFGSFRGGAINNQGASLSITSSRFMNNSSSGDGGAVYQDNGGDAQIRNTLFGDNQSAGNGGALANNGELLLESVTVTSNQAATFGGGLVNGSGANLSIRNSIVAENVSLQGSGRDIGNQASADNLQSQGSNLIGITEPANTGNTVGSFMQPSDQTGSIQLPLDPMLSQSGETRYMPVTGSPAIDTGQNALSDTGGLPCSLVDNRGLVRPQDGNADGDFACDIGAFEVQGGAAIAAPQSGAYFDPARNGEGQVIELLADDIAVMSEFTFDIEGGLLWWTAVGKRIGNSLIFETIDRATGGVWGNEFDPANITRTEIGSMGMVFSTCESTQQPGRIIFDSKPDSGLDNLLNQAARLTTAINCNGTMPNELSVRTGSYFSPQRNGEGLQYIEQANGNVSLVFYGYAPDGSLFWTIASDTLVNGDIVTAQMVYPAVTTQFGNSFDPQHIQREPFGELKLTFNGANDVLIEFAPIVEGFDPLSYSARRLTRPIGFDAAAIQ